MRKVNLVIAFSRFVYRLNWKNRKVIFKSRKIFEGTTTQSQKRKMWCNRTKTRENIADVLEIRSVYKWFIEFKVKINEQKW